MLSLLRTIIHLACVVPLIWVGFVLSSDDPEILGADQVKI